MKRLHLILVLSLSLSPTLSLAAGCSSGKTKHDNGLKAGPGRGVGPNGQGNAAPNSQPRVKNEAQAVQVLMTANDGRIAEGQLAESKGVSPDVKKFAGTVVTGHTDANDRLKSLADEKGIQPESNSVSDRMKYESDTTVGHLEHLGSGMFDGAFLGREISLMQGMLDLIDRDLNPVIKDGDLKNEVASTRAMVADHVKQAQDLSNGLGQPGGGVDDLPPAREGGLPPLPRPDGGPDGGSVAPGDGPPGGGAPGAGGAPGGDAGVL